MKKIAVIGPLLKKTYRLYVSSLHFSLQSKGFTDLRPSFLEVLLVVCENNGTSIKKIGRSLDLKKQTMTNHLNELCQRGYIYRQTSVTDKREQNIYLTEFGEKFKLALLETITGLEEQYGDKLGDVELDRIKMTLENFYQQLKVLEPY